VWESSGPCWQHLGCPACTALVTVMRTWDKIKYQAKYIMYLTLIHRFWENVHQIKLGLVYVGTAWPCGAMSVLYTVHVVPTCAWVLPPTLIWDYLCWHHVVMWRHECIIYGTHGANTCVCVATNRMAERCGQVEVLLWTCKNFPPLGTKPMKMFPGKSQPCPDFVLQIELFPALYRVLSRWPLDCLSFVVRDGASGCCQQGKG
jgi:hypothetical protein